MNVPALLSARTVFALILLPLVIGITGAVVPVPSIADITPDSEVNTTRALTADISGSDFAAGAQVLLVPATACPVHAGSIVDGGSTAPFLNGPEAVFLSSTMVYITSKWSDAPEIVEVTDPAHPVHKGSLLNGTGGVLLVAPTGVVVSGIYAYVTDSGNNALEIVNISNPAHPVHAGSITNGTGGALLYTPKAVSVSGRYAYVVSSGSNALEIVDISDPAAPAHAGTMKDDTRLKNPTSVFVSGNYAYITSSGNNALEIVDISNPANPFHKGTIKDGNGNAPFLKTPTDVYVFRNLAYVASSGINALEIVDVANPSTPVHKSSIRNGIGNASLGGPAGVYVSDHYAYVASAGSDALEIVDVSNPAVPVHLGTIINGAGGALLNVPSGVYVSSPYAYVTSRISNALEIVDIGSVFSLPATLVAVHSGSTITCTFDLTNATAGAYNVVVTNPGGAPGMLVNGFIISAPVPPPTLTGITPSGGSNTTVVSITNLSGINFNTTIKPSVKLNRTGNADIAATNVTALLSTWLTCTFDLTGQEAGSWNVVVTNPDGQEGMFANGFTVFPVVPTILPTTIPTTECTTVPTTKPTTIPTTPVTGGGGGSSPESGRFGRDSSTLVTSPGATAGTRMSFGVSEPNGTGRMEYPYAIVSVFIVPSRSLGSTDLIVTEASTITRPPGNNRTTAGVVAIEPVAVNPSVISSGTITFAVSDGWLQANGLTPAEVTLMRLEDGIWFELPTTYMNQSGNIHFFTATTPGFSYFAITTRGNTTPMNETATVLTPLAAAVSRTPICIATTSVAVSAQRTIPAIILPTTVPSTNAGTDGSVDPT